MEQESKPVSRVRMRISPQTIFTGVKRQKPQVACAEFPDFIISSAPFPLCARGELTELIVKVFDKTEQKCEVLSNLYKLPSTHVLVAMFGARGIFYIICGLLKNKMCRKRVHIELIEAHILDNARNLF